MTFLLDSNIWLELLFGQERTDEVRRFLESVGPDRVAVSDFSVFSIGVILTRAKRDDVFAQFVSDTLEGTSTTVVRLDTAGLKDVVVARRRFGLDFDDAYQYVAAEKHNLTLVSFDADFDRTERGRKTPAEILKTIEEK